jgi:hypothetical protein
MPGKTLESRGRCILREWFPSVSRDKQTLPKRGIIFYDFYKFYNLNIKRYIFNLCNATIPTFISCHNNVFTV